MSQERNFTKPEGRSESDIEFIRANRLDTELLEDGVVLEGTYVDSMPNPLNTDKDDFKFELEDGSTKVINGAGNLGYKMKFINPGDYVQVKYHGKQSIAKGPHAGKQSHNFEVLVAE
jgi:hypothetical protein